MEKNCDSTIFYKKMMLSEFFSEQNPGGKRGKKNCDSTIFLYKNGAVTMLFRKPSSSEAAKARTKHLGLVNSGALLTGCLTAQNETVKAQTFYKRTLSLATNKWFWRSV